jgi:predicted RNA-binding Zn-ribbon protein involved in translation (DUF1610 family)
LLDIYTILLIFFKKKRLSIGALLCLCCFRIFDSHRYTLKSDILKRIIELRVEYTTFYLSTMERRVHPGETVRGVSCPLCGYTDVHYRKETDTYGCGNCDYTWYTIEKCNI